MASVVCSWSIHAVTSEESQNHGKENAGRSDCQSDSKFFTLVVVNL